MSFTIPLKSYGGKGNTVYFEFPQKKSVVDGTPTFKSSVWSFNLCIKAKILLLSLQPKPSLGNLLSNIVQQHVYVVYPCNTTTLLFQPSSSFFFSFLFFLFFFFNIVFLVYSLCYSFMIHSSLASAQHFFHPHRKACQASKALQYSFVVSLLSGNQVNINIAFF